MARFRYYFAQTPHANWPVGSELLSTEADSLDSAVKLISRDDKAWPDWPALWVHVLVWNDGEQRCFQSARLR